MNSENSTNEIAAVMERVRQAEWRQVIVEQQTSSLSVREAVCQQLGSTETTGRYFTDQPAVVPIRTAGVVQCEAVSTEIAPVIEVEAGDLHIRLPQNCPAELIRAILQEA